MAFVLGAAVTAPVVVGKVIEDLSSYAVVVNFEVINRSTRHLEMSKFSMQDGVCEITPSAIGPNEKLLFGCRKANWSLYGCAGTVAWKYGDAEITVTWNVQYKTAVSFLVRNFLTLNITRGSKVWQQDVEGDELAKVCDGIVTITGIVGNSNHTVVKIDITAD